MTVLRLAFAAVAGLAVGGVALPAPATAGGGVGHGSTGFSASADAASLARIRDARPIGQRQENAAERPRQDKVLDALKPVFGKKK
jgi:hypothetical protein